MRSNVCQLDFSSFFEEKAACYRLVVLDDIDSLRFSFHKVEVEQVTEFAILQSNLGKI